MSFPVFAAGLGVGLCLLVGLTATASPRVEFARDFAPASGWVKPPEKPFRAEICLNGAWEFQPVAVPADFRRDTGVPPELTAPRPDAWESTPLRVPSPWNVNTWGCGRDAGAGTSHPYWPDSVYYPSYPAAWDDVEMGWLRRSFRVPPDWGTRRVLVHFEAVAGECQVFVNGRAAGSHFDKYLPFEIDVTSLVNKAGTNELLVGVRAHSLFNHRSARFPKMRLPYPCGSETERLAGIWQDVFLVGVPGVRVEDVFLKPLLDQEVIEAEITIRNDSGKNRVLNVGGEISPWVNLAGRDVLDAPEPKWRLDQPVLNLPATNLTVAPGKTRLLWREPVRGRLKTWAPGSPQLYAALVSLKQAGEVVDRQYTRFGWRQFTLKGQDLLLNGQKIQLFGDLLHPFGPFTQSRRYVWAWYRMIQDFGGNAVRPHAQIHPRHYLELAEEMGLVVLDESALFGSSIALNFDDPVAWSRFEEHCDGLVLRDRNSPSVVGWSIGNELFAIFNLNSVPEAVAAGWYRQLADLGKRVADLDPTRAWISCDGDEDLRGTLPIWSKHFGHGTPLDRLPQIDKPLMVGESGGTYYARPAQLAEFNGPGAFASYAGRNDALGIDVYDNIVRMARPRLAYFSASETAWFGVEHLNYGYADFSRLPGRQDGVFFTAPFTDGKPGMQPERLPPYVATLNPGWDPSLPLYRPLAMFRAEKAALATNGPQPCAWDARHVPAPKPASQATPTIDQARFVGDPQSPLGRRLAGLGLSLGDTPASAPASRVTFLEADHLTETALAEARTVIDHARSEGGVVALMLGGLATLPDQLATLLPAEVRLTDRLATSLTSDPSHPWTAGFTLPDLYFAEDGTDRFIARHGLEGPLLDGARVLLQAANTDWSLFNNAPEKAKCAAVVLYEHLQKPSGAALVECPVGKGRLVLCTIDYRVRTRAADRFWRSLFANMGLKLGAGTESALPAFDEKGVLLNALAIGRFAAPDLASAVSTDFIAETSLRPTNGLVTAGLTWRVLNSPSRDRFILHEANQPGPADGAFAAYFSYWINSPRTLDDLLAGGPDAPHFTTFCYASERCLLFLNGRPLYPARTEPADYRSLQVYEDVPLQKGWNHFLVKVASSEVKGDHPATLAIRISSNRDDYFRQLDTAVEVNPSMAAPGAR